MEKIMVNFGFSALPIANPDIYKNAQANIFPQITTANLSYSSENKGTKFQYRVNEKLII